MTARHAVGYVSIDAQALWPKRPDPWARLRPALVIGEDLSDHVARIGGERGVRVPVVRQLDGRFPNVLKAAEPLSTGTDPDSYYTFGVDLLIAGIEAMAFRSSMEGS